MEIHFVNVGKGNCTIIDFPSGHLSIIDIDNSRHTPENELTCPIDYLEENFKGKNIFRFILTHPDMDHMSGIHELKTKFPIINFWDTENDKTLTITDIKKSPFYDEKDWTTYQTLSESKENPKALQIKRNESRDYWNSDGITVLAPCDTLIKLSKDTNDTDADKYNHLSYVLRVDFKGIRILLGGDATIAAWEDILEKCGKESLKADIFLAPHHGSKNNVNEEVFKHISPDYVIVSVDKGVEYDYKYYSGLAKKSVLSTKYYGNIKLNIKEDGTFLPFTVEKNGGK
jgi:competence protein ComEC